MAKEMEEDLGMGLEEAVAEQEQTQEEKKSGRRREQTQEEVAAINAGIEKLKEVGLNEKTLQILAILAPVWNSNDKEAIQAAKDEVIKNFGGSEALKDFIDGDYQTAMLPFVGIAKIMPIANNIKSFYARRTTSKKPATVQINIGGTMYNVDKSYYETIKDKSKDERRELVLAHPLTSKSDDVMEML